MRSMCKLVGIIPFAFLTIGGSLRSHALVKDLDHENDEQGLQNIEIALQRGLRYLQVARERGE